MPHELKDKTKATPRIDVRDLPPKFIGGHPRSGTTLLNSLFDSHPNVLTIPRESQFFYRYIKYNHVPDVHRRTLLYTGHPHDGKQKQTWTDVDIGHKWRPLPYFKFLLENNPNVLKNLYPVVERNDPQDIFWGIVDQFYQTYWNRPEKPVAFLERTPGNELYFLWLNEKFPNLKFVYMLRNPVHMIHSHMKRCKDKAPKARRKLVIARIISWKLSVALACRYREEYGDRFRIFRFEQLLGDTKKTLEEMTSFFEIPFTESLLHSTIFGQKQHIFTHQFSHEEKKGTIEPKMLKKDIYDALTEEDVRLIDFFTRQERKIFGYPDTAPGEPSVLTNIGSWLGPLRSGNWKHAFYLMTFPTLYARMIESREYKLLSKRK